MNNLPVNKRVAEAFHSCANNYDKNVQVQKRVVSNLARIVSDHVACHPETMLDVGCGTGALIERLHSLYPDALPCAVDFAENMCSKTSAKLGSAGVVVNGTVENLPFKSNTIDLLVSSSVLQWISDLPHAFEEMSRVVKKGGSMHLAFFCEGSLSELHHCLNEVFTQPGNTYSRLHKFKEVSYVSNLAEKLQFENVVVNVESETDWYDDLFALLRSIKNIGAGTVTGGAVRGLGWRSVLQKTSGLYAERYGNNGRIPATYKVLYLSASGRK